MAAEHSRPFHDSSDAQCKHAWATYRLDDAVPAGHIELSAVDNGLCGGVHVMAELVAGEKKEARSCGYEGGRRCETQAVEKNKQADFDERR